jgi:PAS domain-containing protein
LARITPVAESPEYEASLRALVRVEARLEARLPHDDGRASAGLRALATALQMLRVLHDELVVHGECMVLEERRYAQLFGQSPHAYLVTDAQANIEQANTAAGALLKRSPRSLDDKCLWVYVHQRERKNFLRRLALYAAGVGDASAWETTLLPRQGDPVRVSVGLGAQQDARGAPRRIVWSLAPA